MHRPPAGTPVNTSFHRRSNKLKLVLVPAAALVDDVTDLVRLALVRVDGGGLRCHRRGHLDGVSQVFGAKCLSTVMAAGLGIEGIALWAGIKGADDLTQGVSGDWAARGR